MNRLKKNFNYFGKDLEAMSYAKNYHAWILSEIGQFVGRNIAEVGAGTGDMSVLLSCLDYDELVLYEPSYNMFPVLKNRFLSESAVSVKQQFFGDEKDIHTKKFDTIIYINVLEHVENDKAELEIAYKKLNRNGHIIIFVPALMCLYSGVDKQFGHVRRYQKKNLEERVIKTGFNIIKSSYFDIIGILPWYIFFVLLKMPFLKKNVTLYDSFIVPISRIIERRFSMPIGKNILLVARK